ncbi:MAG: YhjD/YihY/BrkB family envelope integrity protein, partial [Ignavibacteriaceae bacterium]
MSKIKFSPKGIWKFTVDVFDKFIDDKCPKLGAALSPLLIITIGVAGLIFGDDAARGQIVGELESLVGYKSAEMIQSALQQVSFSTANIIAIVVSLITMIIGSTVVFVDLQDSLNMVWKIKPKP